MQVGSLVLSHEAVVMSPPRPAGRRTRVGGLRTEGCGVGSRRVRFGAVPVAMLRVTLRTELTAFVDT